MKSPLAVRSCTALNDLREYAFDPDVALSESWAASKPVRTFALWTVAFPSPAVTVWLHAEKSPDSKPSLKIVSALAGPALASHARTSAAPTVRRSRPWRTTHARRQNRPRLSSSSYGTSSDLDVTGLPPRGSGRPALPDGLYERTGRSLTPDARKGDRARVRVAVVSD